MGAGVGVSWVPGGAVGAGREAFILGEGEPVKVVTLIEVVQKDKLPGDLL